MADSTIAYKVILKDQEGNYLIPFVGNEINAKYDADGNVIADTYVTKADAETTYLGIDETAASATVASRIGDDTVGGTAQPVYLKEGVPTALSDTVGSASKPVYLSGGTVTASSSTVGSATKPMYLSGGTLTASSNTVGAATRPVWLSSGTITAVSASGATAGSYGQGSAQTGTSSKTIYVPYITVNSYGYVTGISSQAVYIPSTVSCSNCSNCDCCDSN